jgi:hypothetical protein
MFCRGKIAAAEKEEFFLSWWGPVIVKEMEGISGAL